MVFVVARLFFKHAVEMTVSLKHVYHLLPTWWWDVEVKCTVLLFLWNKRKHLAFPGGSSEIYHKFYFHDSFCSIEMFIKKTRICFMSSNSSSISLITTF
jgi:hypothetical protein